MEPLLNVYPEGTLLHRREEEGQAQQSRGFAPGPGRGLACSWTSFFRFRLQFLLTARTGSGAPKQKLVALPVAASSQDRSWLVAKTQQRNEKNDI